MSYILDALRKADADRERGHVPNIHAQTVLPGAAPVGAARGPRIGLWIALGALLLVTAVGLTWWLVGGSAQRDLPPSAAAARPAPTPAAAMPAPVPMTAASADAPKAAAPAAASTPAAHAATPKPKPKPAAVPAAALPKTPTPATATDASPTPAQIPGAATTTGPHAGKIYAIAELPEDIRRQLPPVSVGGSMYSPVPANRILIVNGQVLHEGERVTPEVVLEQVRVKAAVLNFKGYRYLVNF